jgi:hypothetical protein
MSSDVWQQSNAALRVFCCLRATDPVPGEPEDEPGPVQFTTLLPLRCKQKANPPPWETD